MEVSTDSTTQSLNMYDYINNFLLTPGVFIIIIVIIIVYFVLFSNLGKSESRNSGEGFSTASSSTDTTTSGSSKIFGIIMIGVFIILIAINGVQYFFGIDVTASVSNLFNGNPQVNIVVDESKLDSSSVPEIKIKKQVFNIPGNEYGYNDAKTLCTAYGARLASYSEVEEAYNNGAEWCNYGWSDDQMALYPTQKNTFDTLQTVKGHEHDCGRPGINGGYIANPAVKFGVNCYGYKPRITQDEQEKMDTSELYPVNQKDIAMEKRVDYWKGRLDEILVSPFNSDTWSKL